MGDYSMHWPRKNEVHILFFRYLNKMLSANEENTPKEGKSLPPWLILDQKQKNYVLNTDHIEDRMRKTHAAIPLKQFFCSSANEQETFFSVLVIGNATHSDLIVYGVCTLYSKIYNGSYWQKR